MGDLSQIVPFFSNFSPISYQLHAFFLRFLEGILAISQISPFPPFCHHFPIFHIVPSPCG